MSGVDPAEISREGAGEFCMKFGARIYLKLLQWGCAPLTSWIHA